MLTAKNKKLNRAFEEKVYADLLRYFKSVNSRKDLDSFFNKLMTSDEKNMILRRLVVMKLIVQGKKYRQIREVCDTSNDVISKASETLKGRGYKKDPDKKKNYSSLSSDKKKFKSFTKRYKGAENIINILDYL